jgi:LPS sulfotransferase NodH
VKSAAIVEFKSLLVQLKPDTDQAPVRYVTDERLDFNHFRPLSKSYIVASSYRSGSQYLCWRLWQTGLLGAPSEILNPTSELRVFMNRLKASSPADYIAKLIARRTSRNGVFGIKAHFHHFQAFQNEYPQLLEVLAPVTYVYISREDRAAQAVSMAKALQTDWWTSRMEEGPKPVLRYDREMIARCLEEIEQQDLNWRQWFEAQGITPFQVTYDKLTADATTVVRSFVEILGVQNDEPDDVDVPPAKKQADETNIEWIERFRREQGDGERGAEAAAEAPPVSAAAGVQRSNADLQRSNADLHFFDRFNRLIKSMPAEGASTTGFLEEIRLRRRYDVIVARNRELFRDARVLDIMSSDGFWTLAAIDAGAAHTTGIEVSMAQIKSAERNFKEHSISQNSYRFISSRVFDALPEFTPKTFDLVLCHGFLELCDSYQFFQLTKRLQPKQIILDTGVVRGEGPIVRYSVSGSDILATPNHALIMFLCDAFKFRWRLIDWRAMGLSDWTGIHDYERDNRRTYILELIV